MWWLGEAAVWQQQQDHALEFLLEVNSPASVCCAWVICPPCAVQHMAGTSQMHDGEAAVVAGSGVQHEEAAVLEG